MLKKALTGLNEISNLETGINGSGTMLATELAAIIPNALAAPFQHYHELEVKMKLLESAMKLQTSERATICNTMVELAKLGELTSERFQMFMVVYGMKRF